MKRDKPLVFPYRGSTNKLVVSAIVPASIATRIFGAQRLDQKLVTPNEFAPAQVWLDTEGNWTLYIVRLNDDYTAPETPMVQGKTWARVLVSEEWDLGWFDKSPSQ